MSVADAGAVVLPAAVSSPDRSTPAALSCLLNNHICGVLTWLFVGLTILSRLIRYARCPALWDDEHFQAAAFLDHGYLDLLNPLPYEQVAPVGFLWIELTFVKLLGF